MMTKIVPRHHISIYQYLSTHYMTEYTNNSHVGTFPSHREDNEFQPTGLYRSHQTMLRTPQLIISRLTPKAPLVIDTILRDI